MTTKMSSVFGPRWGSTPTPSLGAYKLVLRARHGQMVISTFGKSQRCSTGVFRQWTGVGLCRVFIFVTRTRTHWTRIHDNLEVSRDFLCLLFLFITWELLHISSVFSVIAFAVGH